MRKLVLPLMLALLSLHMPQAGSQEPARPEDLDYVQSETRVVFNAYHSPVFNPQSFRLAYLSDAFTALPGVAGIRWLRHDLWVMDVRLEQRTGTWQRWQMTGTSACQSVCWSPDGRSLLVSLSNSERPENTGLWLMPAQGGGQQAVRTNLRPDVLPLGLAWAPAPAGSTTVAYISKEQPGEGTAAGGPTLWLMDVQKPEDRRSYPPPAELNLTIAPRSGLVWSDDGKAIYFVGEQRTESGEPAAAIWRVLPKAVPPTFEKVLEETSNYAFASLAPIRGTGTLGLLLMRKEELPSSKVWLGVVRPGSPHVKLISDVLPVDAGTALPYSSQISFSLDGRMVAVTEGKEIWILNLATRAELVTERCVDNLRALYQAFVKYANDHGGELPTPRHDPEHLSPMDQYFWVTAIGPYLASPDVLKCTTSETQPSSYVFDPALWGAKSADVAARPTTPLLQERIARHDGKRSILLVTGDVRTE